MLYTTTKPTTYLIDGCNLVRSFLYEFARTEDEVTADFLDFLEDMSCDPRYNMHTYEVIFDGTFRPVGPLYRAGVHISFTEENTADQVIYERANYAAQTGARVVAGVGLSPALRERGNDLRERVVHLLAGGVDVRGRHVLEVDVGQVV